jgi:hypothetical protein
MARLTLWRETVSAWASRRYGVKRGAGHPVAREPRARGSRSLTASITGAILPGAVGGRPLRVPGATRTLRACPGRC